MENNQAKKLIPYAERGDVACQFSVEKKGVFLRIVFASFEIDLVKKYVQNDVSLAFFENREILYFLCEFEGCGWMDAPFHSSINPQDRRGFPAGFKPGVDALDMDVEMTDITGNVGIAKRRLKIEPRMAKRLYEISCTQQTNPISSIEYNKRVEYAFSKYPVKTMVKRATSTCFVQVEPDLIGGEAANDNAEKNIRKVYPSAKETNTDSKVAKSTNVEVADATWKANLLGLQFTQVNVDNEYTSYPKFSPEFEPSVEACLALIQDSLRTEFLQLSIGQRSYPVRVEHGDGNFSVTLCFSGNHFDDLNTALAFAININEKTGANTWEMLRDYCEFFDDDKLCPSGPWIAYGSAAVGRNESRAEHTELMQWSAHIAFCMGCAYLRYFSKL